MRTREDLSAWEHGRKRVEFWALRGEVMAVNNTSHTSVVSGGGGGWVGPYGGHVSAPVIESITRYSGSFWLRDREGKEYEIGTGRLHLALRPGHQVCVLLCGRAARPRQQPLTCTVVNFTTDERLDVFTPHLLNRRMKLTRRVGALHLIAVAAVFLALAEPGRGGDAIVKAVVMTMVAGVLNAVRIGVIERSLARHVDSLVRSL